MCNDCVKIKDKPLAYTRCTACGNWRPLTVQEKHKIARRKQ